MKTVAVVCGLCLAVAAAVFGQGATLQAVGGLAGPVDHVRAANGQLYLSAGRTLEVVDVGDPRNPERRGAYEFPEQVWGFRVAGARAYVDENRVK